MHVRVIRKRLIHAAVLACLVCLLQPGAGRTQSGFYRYVDEGGTVRYTDNPANIPSGHVPPDASGSSPVGPKEAQQGPEGPQRTVVNYDAKDGSIFVRAVLNRHYPVWCQVDTGATRSMITQNDADMLNLPVESARSIRGLIADGSIVEMPVTRMASVQVGEALVEDLEVAVGKVRLLGMDFLENFEMSINAQAGQLVLVAKDSPVLRGQGREPESALARQDREQARRDIDNQISQLTIAITTRRSTIEQYREDISDAETKRAASASSLDSLRSQTRFQGSGVSRSDERLSAISRNEENISEIDAYIQNRLDNIKLQEEQIAGMQGRINHLRALRRRID